MKSSYRLYIVISVLLHLLLLGALSLSMLWPKSESKPAAMQPLIQAKAVSSEVVKQQEKHLQDQRKKRKQQEAKRLAEIKKQQQQIRQKKQAEQKRLKQLQIKRQREAAARKKAELERQLAQRKAKAEKARKAQEEAKRKAEAERKAKAEAKRKAKAEAERKAAAERKAKAEAARKKAEALKRKQEAEQQILNDMKAEQAARAQAKRQRQIQTEIQKYQAMITSAIQQNVIIDDSLKGTTCKLTVKLARSGFIVSVGQATGDPRACQAAKTAVYKTGSVPVSADQDVFAKMKVLNITLKPGG